VALALTGAGLALGFEGILPGITGLHLAAADSVNRDQPARIRLGRARRLHRNRVLFGHAGREEITVVAHQQTGSGEVAYEEFLQQIERLSCPASWSLSSTKRFGNLRAMIRVKQQPRRFFAPRQRLHKVARALGRPETGILLSSRPRARMRAPSLIGLAGYPHICIARQAFQKGHVRIKGADAPSGQTRPSQGPAARTTVPSSG